MTSGPPASDTFAISKLAWDVYNGYKDAADNLKDISDEIKSLHAIIDNNNIQAKLQDPKLPPEERGRLRKIIQGCTDVLRDLDKFPIKYKMLGSPQSSSSRALDQVQDDIDIAELRERLTSNIILLNMFVIRYG